MTKNSLLKNGFWATYGALATRFLALFSNLLLARLLLPSEFGVIGTAYIFWSFVNLFTQDTVGSFLVYKGIEDKRYVNTTYTISLCIGLILAVAMVGISHEAAKFFGVENLVWILSVFACNLVVSFVCSTYTGVLTRRTQYKELANSNMISSMTRVFSTVGCAAAGLSYWSFVIGDTAFWLMLFILLRRHVKLNFQLQIDPVARPEVLSYCFGAMGNSFGYYVNANGDNFVVGRFLGTTNLGYYNFAYQLTMALPTILGQVMSQVGMSAFAKISDDKQQEKALLKVVEQMAFLAAPVYALFFLVIDQYTVSFIFGAKWIPSTTVIPWLLIFAYFRLLNASLSSMLFAKGRPGINARVNMLIAPVAVCGFIIGVDNGGIIGVGIAVAAVLGIIWTCYWWWVGCRELGWSINQFLIPLFKPAIIALIVSLFALNLPEIVQPFFFIIIYITTIRLTAAKQFNQYQFMLGKVFKLGVRS